jgi:hypothetical protein
VGRVWGIESRAGTGLARAGGRVGGSNVRVLVADPGDMDTQMHRDAVPDADPAELRDPADPARALLNAIATMGAPFKRIRLGELVAA